MRNKVISLLLATILVLSMFQFSNVGASSEAPTFVREVDNIGFCFMQGNVSTPGEENKYINWEYNTTAGRYNVWVKDTYYPTAGANHKFNKNQGPILKIMNANSEMNCVLLDDKCDAITLRYIQGNGTATSKSNSVVQYTDKNKAKYVPAGTYYSSFNNRELTNAEYNNMGQFARVLYANSPEADTPAYMMPGKYIDFVLAIGDGTTTEEIQNDPNSKYIAFHCSLQLMLKKLEISTNLTAQALSPDGFNYDQTKYTFDIGEADTVTLNCEGMWGNAERISFWNKSDDDGVHGNTEYNPIIVDENKYSFSVSDLPRLDSGIPYICINISYDPTVDPSIAENTKDTTYTIAFMPDIRPSVDLVTDVVNWSGNVYTVDKDTDSCIYLDATVEYYKEYSLSYQWYSADNSSLAAQYRGEAIQGANSSSFSINTDYANQFFYYCGVTNSVGETTSPIVYSEPITVNVRATTPSAPIISGQYYDSEIIAGNPARIQNDLQITIPDKEFSKVFPYGVEVTYQWYLCNNAEDQNGTPVGAVDTSTVGTNYYYRKITATAYGESASSKTNTVKVTILPVPGAEALAGSGSEDDPFLIASLDDMLIIKNLVESGQGLTGRYLKLTNDLTLPYNWEPIGNCINGADPEDPNNHGVNGGKGNNLNPFMGTLDGNGHLITIEKGGKAPFRFVRQATIKNLSVFGEEITGSALVYQGTLDYGPTGEYDQNNPIRCVDIENVTLKRGSHTSAAGFLPGSASGMNEVNIKDSIIESGVVVGNPGQSAGGSFVRDFNGHIDHCVSYATVYGTGGLAGNKDQTMGPCDITNSAFVGSLISEYYAGGIIGSGYGFADYYNITLGQMSGTSAPNSPVVTIRNCYVAADITGRYMVGGIFGGEPVVEECWTNGAGAICDNVFVGTLTALPPSETTNTRLDETYVGGIVGFMRSFSASQGLQNCFYLAKDGEGNLIESGVGQVDLLLWTDEEEAGMTVDIPGVANGGAKKVYSKYYGYDAVPDFAVYCDPVTETELTDNSVVTKLNTSETSYKNWVQGDDYPVIDGSSPVPQSLTISGDYQTKYTIGEALNTSGMVFTVTYSNGKTEALSADKITFTGFDSSTQGTCSVKATYGPVSIKDPFTVWILLPEPEAITVSFALYGDTVHASNVGPHTLADSNLIEWIPTTVYEIDENTTVFDVFKKALTDPKYEGRFSWVNSEGVNAEGNYISSITNGDTTLAEFSNGVNTSGWKYTLNGVYSSNGISEQFLKDGDCILFHFTDDYTKEANMTGNAVQNMTMETETLTVEAGKTGELSVSFEPKLLNGNVRLDWSSEDMSIATVDSKGVVTGIAEGETKITAEAKDAGFSVTATVNVVAGSAPTIQVESVTVSPTSLTLKEGETGTLTATVLPDNATSKDVQWSSADTSVATVDSKGVVTGIAKGETTITATAAGGKNASVTVEVKAEEQEEPQEPEEITYPVALKAVLQYLEDEVPNPKMAETSGEWAVFTLNRGNAAKANWNDTYLANLAKTLDVKNGVLAESIKYSPYSRVILALTSLGVDASQVTTDKATYDLVKPLLDKDEDGNYMVEAQGNNGTIFALLALDSHDYLPGAEGKALRAGLITSLKENRLDNGAWAISGKTVPDLDMTAAAVYALAPYYKDESKLASLGGAMTHDEVKAMVDGALAYLSKQQAADGGFGSVEADVWTLIALATLDRDADEDKDFVKADGSLLDDLLRYYDSSTGGFKHELAGKVNQIASEQAAYGLVAYDRFKNGKNTLYDMTDVEIASLEEKADKAAAEEVEDLIDAIGEVTLESKAKIDAARAAYDALTDEQKALVGNLKTLTDAEAAYEKLKADAKQDELDKAAAKGVEDLIEAIGKVTLESEKAIKAARAAYDALTDTQKALVKNLATLEDAEKQLKDMQEAAEILAAVTFHLRNGSSEEITDGEEKVYTKGDEGKDLPDASREGYEFQGWFDFPTDGTKYTKVSADLPEDLYAQWKSTGSGGGSSGSSETKIKVSFRLIGAEKADKKVDLGTEEYMPDYVTWIATSTYEMDEGDTVYDLWVKALRDNGITSEGAESNYVKTVYAPASLGGYALSEFTNGPRSGWMYTLNGRHPGYGLEEQELHDGDRIIWHYVNDYAYEVPDWFDEGAWQSLGDGRYYSRWLKAPDRFGGAGGGLGEGAKSSSSGGGSGSSGSDEVADLIPSYDGDTVWIPTEVEHSEGGMAYAADAELTKDIVTKGLEKAEDKSKLKLWVDIQDSNRLVLQVDPDAMKEISDAGAGLRLQCSKGVIELDAKTVAQLAESGRQVRMTVSYDDWNEKTKVSVGAFPPKDTDTPVTMKIELPVTKDGQALSIVNSDGSRTPIKKSAIIGDRAYAEITGAATLEITEIHKYWNDVKEKDWFAEAVQFAVSHELMNGVDRYEFAPNAPMTRAMLVTVLYRLEDEPEITGSGDSFGDVDADGWYAEAVAWASETGIVNGTENGFEPNSNITREQIATILYRYAKYIGLVGEDTEFSGDVSQFGDGESVSSWAKEAMAWAVQVGLFKGDDTNSLNPQGEATRAEVATLLERLIKLIVLS